MTEAHMLLRAPAREAVTLGPAALDTLMPFHLLLDDAGQILRAGPTALKLAGGGLAGRPFLSVVQIRRPRRISAFPDLAPHYGKRLVLHYRALPDQRLSGVALDLGHAGQVLVNMAPGAAVAELAAARGLTGRDFSPAEPAQEIIALLHMQRILMAESTRLNARLHGDKTKAERKAYTDALTGLANRRALERQLERLLRRNGRAPFALMQIDLDRFKQVNDTEGHAAGDHVLKEVAQRMLEAVRPTDLVCRMGGDEFVVLVSGFEGEEGLARVGQRLIETISAPIPWGDGALEVGASIGATIVSAASERSAEEILDAADRALYRSKREGRGRYHLDRDA